MALGGALLIAVCAFLIARVISQWVLMEDKLAEAQTPLARLLGNKSPQVSFRRGVSLSGIVFVQKFLRQQSFSKILMLYLKRANLGISVAVFFLGSFLLAAVALFFLSDRLPLWMAFPLALGIGILPAVYLRIKNKRYIRLFGERLPEALMTLSGAIKVGLGLESAMKEVVTNAPYPVSIEFKIVSGEIAFGVPMDRAIHNLYRRIPTREVQILATAIAIHNQLGGNLSEVLVNLQNTIRERLGIQREINVLGAQGKFTSMVLVLVPVFVAGMWFFMDHENFVEFLRADIGKWVSGLAIFSVLMAFLMIRKIIKVSD